MKRPTLLPLLLLAMLAAPPTSAALAQEPLRLTLGDAVRRAAGQAPGVEISGLRVEAAQGRIRQQRAGLLPSLALSAGWLNRTFNLRALGIDFSSVPGSPPAPERIGPFDNIDARIRLVQPVLDLAANARVRVSHSQVTASQADAASAAESAGRTAALAYLRLARGNAQVAARREDSTLAAELVGLARSQREAGVATPLDVTRSRTQLVVAREGIVQAQAAVGRASVELARALGLPANVLLTASEPLSDSIARVPLVLERDVAVTRALERRPEIQAEAARVRAAEQGVWAIDAERLPRLELSGDYGVNGPTAADAIPTRQLAVQLSFPVLDGFRREGRLDEQRAVLEETVVRRRELERDIAAEVDIALLELRSARAQQEIAAERRRLAEEELQQARERFSAGVVGNIEVIDAQVSLLHARDTEIEARFVAAAARVALARAVGMVGGLQ